jgi:hypothetical protein
VNVPFNHPPIAVPRISPLFSILPSETNLYVLSPDGIRATVVFDASQSYDVDDQSLNFTWYLDGQTNLAGTSMFLTNILSIGLHSLQLVVSDGFTSSTAGLTFEVIPPATAVDQLLLLTADTDSLARSQRPLLESLVAAETSFGKYQFHTGVNQLQAFQNKVQAQVVPFSPALASELMSAAVLIANTVSLH